MILLSNAYHCEIFRCEIFRKDTIFILIDKIYLISNIKTKYNIQCRNPYSRNCDYKPRVFSSISMGFRHQNHGT